MLRVLIEDALHRRDGRPVGDSLKAVATGVHPVVSQSAAISFIIHQVGITYEGVAEKVEIGELGCPAWLVVEEYYYILAICTTIECTREGQLDISLVGIEETSTAV